MLYRHLSRYDIGIRHYLIIYIEYKCREYGGGILKVEEVCQTFAISLKRLQSFENAGLLDTVHEKGVHKEYEEADIEQLSLILTLCDIGFDFAQIKQFLDTTADTKTKNIKAQLLKKQRLSILETIHTLQKKIDTIDCLLYQMNNKKI